MTIVRENRDEGGIYSFKVRMAERSVNFMVCENCYYIDPFTMINNVLIEKVSTAERFEERNRDVACKIGSATG